VPAAIEVKPIARFTAKNGITGTIRRPNRYTPPSRASPRLIARRRDPNRRSAASRNTVRAARKASNAPRLDAKETIRVPSSTPNSAPASKVNAVAIGSEAAVAST